MLLLTLFGGLGFAFTKIALEGEREGKEREKGEKRDLC